jgi:hypothetical protein
MLSLNNQAINDFKQKMKPEPQELRKTIFSKQINNPGIEKR